MSDIDGSERMVELAVCSSSYESDLVQGLLAQAGIPCEVDEMSPQFGFTTGAAAVSHVRVFESDLERARQAIAPPDDEDEIEEIEETPAEKEAAVHARRERRYKIARFFLVMTGVAYLGVALLAAGASATDAGANAAVGAVLLVLTYQSYRRPRGTFLLSFLVSAGATLWGILVERPFLILPGLGVLLSSYFAHQVAKRADETSSGRRRTR